jgi:hypothetical protein
MSEFCTPATSFEPLWELYDSILAHNYGAESNVTSLMRPRRVLVHTG